MQKSRLGSLLIAALVLIKLALWAISPRSTTGGELQQPAYQRDAEHFGADPDVVRDLPDHPAALLPPQ